MINELLLFLGIVLLGFIFLFIFLNKKISELKKPDTDQALVAWLRSMQTSLETTNKTLHQSMQSNSTTMVQTLQENSRQLNQRLDTAAKVIRDVGKEVGQMSEIGRS